jgi:proline racemase
VKYTSHSIIICNFNSFIKKTNTIKLKKTINFPHIQGRHFIHNKTHFQPGFDPLYLDFIQLNKKYKRHFNFSYKIRIIENNALSVQIL